MKAICLTLILALTSPAFSAEPIQLPTASQFQAGGEVTVGVKGMVCAFCAQGIEKAFMKQPEVEKVQVSLQNKFIKIKFQEGQSLSKEKIIELLKDAGYEAVFNR